MEHRTNPLHSIGHEQRAKSEMGQLRHLLTYLRPYKFAIFGALIAIGISSSSVLALGHGLRYLVDEGLGKGNPELLDNAFVILLIVTLLLAGAAYFRFYLVSWIGEHVVTDIRRDVYNHVISLDIGFYETTRTGEILSRITTDTTLLQTVVGSTVSVALRNTLLLIGGTILLTVTSAKLTGYVFAILPIVVIPIIFLGRKVRTLSRETQNRVADISAQAEETVSGIRTIQALSLETAESGRFSSITEKALQTALSRIRMRALLTSIVITLVFGAVVTVLWVGGHDVLSGRISAGELSAFVFYSVLVAASTGAISEVIGDLQRAAGAAERLMELLQSPNAITAPQTPEKLEDPIKGNITFHHVNFSYPTRMDKPALHAFNLDIAPGETIALVGPSGAGKSTVLQLLLRYYDPQAGNIEIDGMDIRALDPRDLRRCLGSVPQDPIIFSTNVWENIRCGRPGASEQEIINAAKAAAADEFIVKLPDSYDTYLGEKGIRLSGGQRQRIAIARAIVRNPRILLLDEATSALDSENEKLVQQAMHDLMKDRTTIVIAHRLATVLKADRIIVLDGGKIETIGTHQQLLSTSPLYARLAQLQFEIAA